MGSIFVLILVLMECRIYNLFISPLVILYCLAVMVEPLDLQYRSTFSQEFSQM